LRQAAAELPRTREALPQGGKSAAMSVVEFVSFLCAVNYTKIRMFMGGKTPEGLLPPNQIFPAAKCGVVKCKVLKHKPPPKRAAAEQ
jgi:hypothetical protein